ncbi:fasciclin domain-containing protein [Snuella lapsa]
MKHFNFLMLFTVAFVLFIACSNDDDDSPIIMTDTITALAVATPDLSNLVSALQRAGLANEFNGSASYTVFAPTNAAFAAFLSANGFTSVEDVPVDVLTQILKNHVLSGVAKSSDLESGYVTNLADGPTSGTHLSMYINTTSGVTINGNSDVTQADIMASNGVIHIVDAVIGLPSIVDFVLADNTFSILRSALTRADLTFDYVTTLSTPNGTDPAPFTVFAPTNDAFVSLLDELGANSLDDIDESTLKATLNLHAVAGANVLSSGLSDDMTVATLGGDITANVSGGATLTDSNGRISNIIVTDVQAANGIIHVIDKVVLPKLPQTIVGKALDTPSLSILVEALQAADGDLVSVLGSTGPFTVLAPTNDAFTTFLSDNGYSSVNDVPTAALTQILLNHVISGSAIMSTDLMASGSGYASTNATGVGDNAMSLFFDTSNGVIFNGISTVTTADIEATNGVIHIVDKVIGLPNIVDHVVANPNLSNLVGLLTNGGNTTFTNLLSTAGDFTVFAPSNDAITAFSNPDNNAIETILSNHVIAGVSAASTGLTNSYVNTLATFGNTDKNLSLYINVDNGVWINGISQVETADIITSNGIIHTVNAVIDIPTVVTFATADPNFSTLVSALTELTPNTDFVATLSTANSTSPAPFTIFAPTNDAFAAITIPSDETVLAQILSHHVITDMNITSGDLTPNGDTTAQSLEGDNLTISLPGSGDNIADLTDGSGNSDIGIIKVDVQAGNGVIHVINKVALPM